MRRSTRFVDLHDTIRSSFWFVPTVMTLLAAVLAPAMIAFDRRAQGTWLETFGWTYTGGPEGARALLSTAAGSVITAASIVFSITVTALALASTQFGPRLLRNFIRDRGNQVVLGTFNATFLYCLLVLRTVRDVNEAVFVPHQSVTMGILLTIASLGVLIYFIHHVAVSIQAASVVARVARELDHAIDHLFPRNLGHASGDDPARDLPPDFEKAAPPVPSRRSGYLQAIDDQRVLGLAQKYDLVLSLGYRPGDFVVRGEPLARVWPPQPAPVARQIGDALNDAFITGASRTLTQDVEFAVNQLVEIAVRALSPGINDPFTAMTCVDHLGAALCHLARKPFPSPYRYDDAGRLRVIAERVSFPGIVDAALHQIRQYARGSAAVTLRLLETIAVVARHIQHPEDGEALRRHAELVRRAGIEGLPEASDREDVEERYREALRALDSPDAPPMEHRRKSA